MAFRYKAHRRYLIAQPGSGQWGDGITYGMAVLSGPTGRELMVQFSAGDGWEHVSASVVRLKPHKPGTQSGTIKPTGKIPNWDEMSFLKGIFWDPEDCVVQYHPPESEYVNFLNVLHLWRPIDVDLPRPPAILVGPPTQEKTA